jgi:hypothetical protein
MRGGTNAQRGRQPVLEMTRYIPRRTAVAVPIIKSAAVTSNANESPPSSRPSASPFNTFLRPRPARTAMAMTTANSIATVSSLSRRHCGTGSQWAPPQASANRSGKAGTAAMTNIAAQPKPLPTSFTTRTERGANPATHSASARSACGTPARNSPDRGSRTGMRSRLRLVQPLSGRSTCRWPGPAAWR